MKTVIYRVKSPAKINFGLRVLSKRKDGFHNIETIFYTVNLYDHLTIKIAPKSTGLAGNEIKVITNNPLTADFIKEKDNICYKAAKEFFNYFKIKGSYKIVINIRKSIPVGAGLGGGSSNAASVLKTLSKYFNIAKAEAKLFRLALNLGSDVPFFILGKPAYATLRGDKLTLLPGFKIKRKILIVNPNIQVSTKWAYKNLNIKYQISNIKKLNKVEKFLIREKEKFQNDFEKVVFEKYPKIKRVKKKMYEYGAIFSSMSGSGSTIYGLFDSRSIKSAGKFFKSKGYKVFIV